MKALFAQLNRHGLNIMYNIGLTIHPLNIYIEVKLREEVDYDKNLTMISIYKMSYSKQ
jgi:hypothetical protein